MGPHLHRSRSLESQCHRRSRRHIVLRSGATCFRREGHLHLQPTTALCGRWRARPASSASRMPLVCQQLSPATFIHGLLRSPSGCAERERPSRRLQTSLTKSGPRDESGFEKGFSAEGVGEWIRMGPTRGPPPIGERGLVARGRMRLWLDSLTPPSREASPVLASASERPGRCPSQLLVTALKNCYAERRSAAKNRQAPASAICKIATWVTVMARSSSARMMMSCACTSVSSCWR